MDQQMPLAEKQSFLRNDTLLVCGMLTFYGVCILVLIGATIWGLDRRNKQISANATSTANVIATQRANATATVVAHSTAQAKYEFVDRFNDNGQFWFADSVDDEYMKGSTAIQDGMYVWDIQEVKQTFVYWAHFRKGSRLKDFDVYVDTRIADEACSGFAFRAASRDWEDGTYTFSVCNNSYFSVRYTQEEWEDISGWLYSDVIKTNDWNRLEIRARGDHFTFIINNEVVYEMTDERLSKGGVALLVEMEVKEAEPLTIWFDNFGLQPR